MRLPQCLSILPVRCGIGAIAGISFLAASLSCCFAQSYVPSQTYYGRSNYTEYIAGDMPVIFSAPHGGALTPAEIPDRVDDGTDPDFTTVTDSNTEQLALAVQQVFCTYFGHSPHVTICQLKRTKIDCNRTQIEGCGTNVYAIQAWNEFQNFINISSNTAIASSPRAFYIDLHGQGHPIQRLELGYLLTASQLTNTDAALNAGVYSQESSIRQLTSVVATNSGISFAQILRGSNSFGGLLAGLGYPSVPSPTMPSPGNGTNPIVYPGDQNDYFDGGYNTAVHSSQTGNGPVDGVQIESNYNGVRDSATSETNFAYALAQTLDYFFTNYYGLDLRLCAPCNWSVGSGYWGVAGNWDVALPVSGNYLQFRGAGGVVSNNLAALTSGKGRVYALVFGTNASGSYGLYGGAISLVAGITNLSAFPQTVSNGITLLGEQFITAASGPILLGGAITNAGFNLAISNGTNVTIKGVLSGTGGLKKFGNGTLVLVAAGNYTGNTTNFAGTLLASNNTGSATGSGLVMINSGATLAGSGTVGGPVALAGIISPGNGVGTLTVTNGLNFTAGTYVWSLGANATNFAGVNFDQLLLSGGQLAIDSNSTVMISFTNSASAPATNNSFWLAAHSWKIISLSGSATNISGTSFGIVSNGYFSAGKFNSTADAQGNVWLNYVPLTPPVISPALIGAGTTNLSLSWSSVAGVNYQVQYSTNLSKSFWLPLGNTLATGTNTVFLDSGPVQPQRYYRILIP